MTGFIYIIRCGDWAKIGYSRDPARRLREVEKFSPVSGTIVAQFQNPVGGDARLHCYLWRHHMNWEWFSWCSEIAAIVANGLPDLSQLVSCNHLDCPRQSLRLRRLGKQKGWRQVEWAS